MAAVLGDIMRSVIVFGGGGGGGLLITANGVRRIPPFDPAIRLTLKSASAMVNSLAATPGGAIKTKKAKLAASLANLAIEQVEEVVGELAGDQALIYQDDEDGGFYCGSTGKPPIPIPRAPLPVPSLPELMSAGLIEKDLVELLQTAKEKAIPYTQVFEDPADVAKKLGVKVSEKTASDLKLMAPSNVSKLKDPTDREVMNFFHKVADDGRFLREWLTRPSEVASTLKFKLSEAALERIVTGGALSAFGSRLGPNAFADIGVCVAVVTGADVVIIAVVAISSRDINDIVRDRSGLSKF
jgi:hypothetical protein